MTGLNSNDLRFSLAIAMLLAFAWSGGDFARISHRDSLAQDGVGFQQTDHAFHCPSLRGTFGFRVRVILKPASGGSVTESIPAAFCQPSTETGSFPSDFSPSPTLQSQFVRLQV